MNNITKKTQTILFASLIAAMILPFSGMDYANADKQTDNEQILKQMKKIRSTIQDRDGETPKIQGENNSNIQRLNLAIKLQELKVEGKENSPKAKILLEKLNENMKPLIRNVNAGEAEIELNTQSHVSVPYSTSLGVISSCGYTLTGQSTGTLYAYSDYMYIYAQSYYPWGLCPSNPTSLLHNDTVVTITEIISGRYLDQCILTIGDPSGYKFEQCNIDRNSFNIMLVSSNAWYENGWIDRPFSTPAYTFLTY